MRVLIDECLPRKLKQELTDHDARTGLESKLGATVAEMGLTHEGGRFWPVARVALAAPRYGAERKVASAMEPASARLTA